MRSLVGPLAAAVVVLTAAPAWAEPVNQAPVAVDDVLIVHNSGGTDRLVDALANDSDPDGDALTYTAVTPATKGNAFLQGGKLYYKAFLGNTGTDTFTYTVSDGHGSTATGTVTVTLWVDPDAPVVQSISSSAAGSATLTWSAAEGADTYRVYRNGVAVHTGPDLSWTDTGLIDSQGYEYRVSGINGGGWEGWKSEGTLYRRAQSPAPTGLAVSLTDDPTTLSLTWVGVDGGGPWHVYRDGALLTTTTHPQFRDSGLVTGREYSYQVRLDFTGSDVVLYVPSALSSAVRAAPAPLTAIGQYVWDHASTGSLGPVTVAERAIPGGRQQDHVRGIVLQQDGAGPVAVTTDFLEAYTAAGGVAGTLGFPLGDEECDHVVLDCVQVFDGGSIWDSQNTSAHVVPAVIEAGWAASGW